MIIFFSLSLLNFLSFSWSFSLVCLFQIFFLCPDGLFVLIIIFYSLSNKINTLNVHIHTHFPFLLFLSSSLHSAAFVFTPFFFLCVYSSLYHLLIYITKSKLQHDKLQQCFLFYSFLNFLSPFIYKFFFPQLYEAAGALSFFIYFLLF